MFLSSRAVMSMNEHLAQRDRDVPLPPSLQLNPIVISQNSQPFTTSARSNGSSMSYPDSSGEYLDSPRQYMSGERTVIAAANSLPSRVDMVRRQYYDQLRKDEVRHRTHRSVGPILNNALNKSLPNIAENPDAEAKASRRTPQVCVNYIV